MNTRNLLALAATAMLATAAHAGFYLGAGAARLENINDVGGQFVLGYNFDLQPMPLAVELETIGWGEVDSFGNFGAIESAGLSFINLKTALPLGMPGLSAIGGIGIGGAFVDNGFYDDDDSEFAWQAIAGLEYEVIDHLKLGLTGRYLDINDLEKNGIATEWDANWAIAATVGWEF